MLNNLSLVVKIYFIIINNYIKIDKQLEKSKALFKVNDAKKSNVKIKYQTFAISATIKQNFKLLKKALKRKKRFFKLQKYKKRSCKYLNNQIYKYINKKFDKYQKKSHIFYFYDSYTFVNNKKTV